MPPASQPELARTREQFLTSEEIEPHLVRDAILASWWRSRRWNVAADRVDLTYQRDPDLDTPLTRSALPVLRHLREHLDNQPISIILTDSAGLVLTRLDAGRDLDAHLDRVNLAPGFSYAEEYVGTNGIGTALEGGRPMQVFGHEHYAEHLEDLACAGVPIHHPISGKTVGAVDLTCWRRDADPLLLALAKTTAGQIQQALLADSGIRELELLQEYLRTCRRTAGIVFALNNDVVMMNDNARHALDPAEQAVLLAQAAETLAGRNPTASLEVELPSGLKARMFCRPVRGEGRLTGGVVHVKLAERPGGVHLDAVPSPRMFLPGLVGSGGLWLRGCHQVKSVYAAGDWLALEGEAGVGKLAVIRAIHQHDSPGAHFAVIDAAEPGRGWLRDVRTELGTEGALVIQHADQLTGSTLRSLSGLLETARAGGSTPWVAVTLSQRHDGSELADLLRFFPSTVELPPLRYHLEDVPTLVSFFLTRLVPDGRLRCSPEAMQMLSRSSWPGNIEQLFQVLRNIVQHRRSGAIQPGDLPPECRTVSRRLLSPLEAMERDAIVRSLLDWDGSKTKAAAALGMSRATIYRKIHEYGIVAPGK
ncbi:transcriptional regulator of acetoin/glycerol metabolism [Actinoplanes tereljensis]|uniref:Fis family transcriptional regulator n=1 Tax=Paractinoplanes tereljensis TaxID=571912 RepID=A0A919NQ08_9ACTN|nr:GAF domain-containing protein [Actinoplanes tereljensis]GIF22966.1 Fis family transcriptional regulator [Actinoplanes tereljensis]